MGNSQKSKTNDNRGHIDEPSSTVSNLSTTEALDYIEDISKTRNITSIKPEDTKIAKEFQKSKTTPKYSPKDINKIVLGELERKRFSLNLNLSHILYPQADVRVDGITLIDLYRSLIHSVDELGIGRVKFDMCELEMPAYLYTLYKKSKDPRISRKFIFPPGYTYYTGHQTCSLTYDRISQVSDYMTVQILVYNVTISDVYNFVELIVNECRKLNVVEETPNGYIKNIFDKFDYRELLF